MNPRRKRILAWALAAALPLAALLLWRSPGARRSSPAKKTAEEVAGIDLTYLTFDLNNEKKLEVRCRESQRVDDERLLLKGVTATIFKADKLEADIRVRADSGEANSDFHRLELRGDVVISSPEITLSGERFHLAELTLLSTRDEAVFALRDLSGAAGAGLTYDIKKRYVVMKKPRGVLRRDGGTFAFQADELRLSESKRLLLLSGDAAVEQDGAELHARRIALQFGPDFERLEWAGGTGGCHWRSTQTGPGGRRQCRDVSGERIRLENDPLGRLQRIEINGAGAVALEDDAGSGRLSAERIEAEMDCETQGLRVLRSLTRGELSASGRENFTVAGGTMLALFADSGDLSEVQAESKCQFRSGDFKGSAQRIVHDAARARVDLFGRDAVVENGRNRFESPRFTVLQRSRRLASEDGVKATLQPGKKSAVLKARPVFVTAEGMETAEKGGESRFRGKVSLFQDDVELHAGELLFRGGGAGLSCRGGAELKFVRDGQPLALRGQAIDFDPGGSRVVIEGDGRLQQQERTLAGQRVELVFAADETLQDVFARGDASFRREEIQGRAQQLHWRYAQGAVVFRDSAEITRAGAGTTRGRELRYDLDSRQITVASGDDRSETTLAEKRP
jgi:lipopolysaccharide export system protein LptA